MANQQQRSRGRGGFRPSRPEHPNQGWTQHYNPHQEIGRLRWMLDNERAKGIAIFTELQETKEELKRQKQLKEMYINRGKETKRELERMEKYSNPETLGASRIATQLLTMTKQKKKKDLHRDYEELKVAYVVNEEKLQGELQKERDTTRVLKEQLMETQLSHKDVITQYETQILVLKRDLESAAKTEMEKAPASEEPASEEPAAEEENALISEKSPPEEEKALTSKESTVEEKALTSEDSTAEEEKALNSEESIAEEEKALTSEDSPVEEEKALNSEESIAEEEKALTSEELIAEEEIVPAILEPATNQMAPGTSDRPDSSKDHHSFWKIIQHLFCCGKSRKSRKPPTSTRKTS